MSFSPKRIRMMKKYAVLVDTARGGIVDEDAVKDGLGRGELAGAAFDVLATEPPTDTVMASLERAIVTPHIGGSTEEAVLAMGRAAINGLGRTGPRM